MYEEAMRRLVDITRVATTATTYNPYFTHEDLQRLIDQAVETPRDGLDARAYMFDDDWVTYNPYIYSIVTEDEEPELDEKNEKLDGFLGEFIKEAV